MFDRARLWLSALAILAVAFIVWLPTIGWGLPSRDADRFLFGDRRPWTGAEIVALTTTTQPADPMRGADVDADPILDRSKPVVLNDADAKRAAIVRRYRLMSGQPDEFIQFKALSEMAARSGLARLDPRLYQYGGLWMYPVGALVRTAMLVGYIPTPPRGTPAIEFYLDHPEAFGKFYVVARLYSWCWGIVAAFAIAWIARRVTGSIGLATLAAVAFMLLPVTRTATHEAKPHLAGAALCLCAVIAATRHVESGKRRWLIASGALCGAAMAMVVSMLLAGAVLPTMVWLRSRATKPPTKPTAVGSDPETLDARSEPTAQRSAWTDRFRAIVAPLAISLAIAAFVYAATNPFVLINAIAHPAILRSNLGNSTAMYRIGTGAIAAARSEIRIVADGLTPFVAIILALAAGGAIFGRLLVRIVDRSVPRHTPPAAIPIPPSLLLLAAPATLVAVQFVALGAGKPAEYARFGLLAATLACVLLAAAARTLVAAGLRPVAITVGSLAMLSLLLATIGDERRVGVADPFALPLAGRVGLFYEPAPWSAPPLDLFADELVLIVPSGSNVALDGLVWPANLSSQINGGDDRGDWRLNRFERRAITR